ncbi:MAG: TraR/DksA family transcriptional regulator [Treponema sp.]|nr:TraR/DksA family transcriptional regulator [Treponema sp.]
MDQAFIEKMKKELEEEKANLLKSLSDQNDDYKKLMEGGDHGDEVDVASDVIDGRMLESLGVQAQNKLTSINNALKRIEQGTYGKCLKCHQEIPQERLETLPETVLCIKCKAEQERANR